MVLVVVLVAIVVVIVVNITRQCRRDNCRLNTFDVNWRNTGQVRGCVCTRSVLFLKVKGRIRIIDALKNANGATTTVQYGI